MPQKRKEKKWMVVEFRFQRGPYDVLDYITLAQHVRTLNIVNNMFKLGFCPVRRTSIFDYNKDQ